jgi:predicted metal-dependent phosphoesterase TrpH
MNIIVGEEITTHKGEVIGLFLSEEIKPGSLEEVIDEIRDQDGIVYVPHPFDRMRKSRLKGKLNTDHILEVFNSRCIYKEDNRKALQFAVENDLPMGSGSDAHTNLEIGMAFVRMEEFNSKKEFIENLKNGKVFGEISPVWVHGITKILKVFANG